MLDGSTRKFSMEQAGVTYRWQSAAGIWHSAASERQALEGLSLHLAQLGGYRELIPDGEPTRADLMPAVQALSAVLTAAWQHQAARQKLNGLAQERGSLPIDHLAFKAVAEAERCLDKALEGFSVKPAPVTAPGPGGSAGLPR